MAEAVAFSLASKVLSTIASPAFAAAYKEGLSIWEAKDELSKLQITIETIQAVLLDAEKKQKGSAAIKNWIKRLKSVLYDANDLFDEVATRDLVKQQIQKGSHNRISEKVLVSCSKLNPVVSRYSIAKEVKAIRKSLVEISRDMAPFGFMICQNEVPAHGIRAGQDPGCYVDADLVIGREDDKKVLLEMLFNQSDSAFPDPLVIAIVGPIGGLGKTTLAQLIYNDEKVKREFKKMWFACISDITDEGEVLGKIFQSMEKENPRSLSVSQLQSRIRDSVEGHKFLLVLDDVWEDHRGKWQQRMNLLRSCAKGSRVIVTTRLPTVVTAVNAFKAHNLEGLSEENSWYLFKSLAFSMDGENDPERISLGREILKRCKGVPLAIWSVGSLLSERNSLLEWQTIKREGLQAIEKSNNDETMSVIKLSYDHLPSNLKQCFAYCSLFPKDYRFMKYELIFLWVSQGYIEPNSEDTDFMYLLRRGFFQEVEKNKWGEIKSCKMHDIMHDLALYVSGEESIVLTSTTPSNTSSFTCHVSLEDSERDVTLLKVNRLHSCLLMGVNSIRSQTNLDKLCQNFKTLRTLSLKGQGIKQKLPSSIGELKLIRYLDLSSNDFEELPDSMTNLVNLVALNLTGCLRLKVLPKKFRKLASLRYLNIKQCDNLKKMPTKMGELTHLQYLSDYVVGKRSELDELSRLQQQLRGELLVKFIRGIEDEEDFECNWKIPLRAQQLEITGFPGVRIADWGTINGTHNHLSHLTLEHCGKLKHLPPLHCLPNLRWLYLDCLLGLEFVEPEEDYSTSSSPFFPRLQELRLENLPFLKRWRKKTTPTPMAFPLLSHLQIWCCPFLELASFPLCPRVQQLLLMEVDGVSQLPLEFFPVSISPHPPKAVWISSSKWFSAIQDNATSSLRELHIYGCCSFKTLQLASPHLEYARITSCNGLVVLEVATSSLKELTIQSCKELKNITGAVDAPDKLVIEDCPDLDLWELRAHLPDFLLEPAARGQFYFSLMRHWAANSK